MQIYKKLFPKTCKKSYLFQTLKCSEQETCFYTVLHSIESLFMPFLNQWNNAASAISHFSPVWIPMWWLSGFEGLVETLFWAVKVWQIKPRCGSLIGDAGPVLNSLSLVSPRQSTGIWVIGNKQGLCACCFLFVFPSRGRLQVPWEGR